MTWLALDIGGANLKTSNGADYAAAQPFSLWKQPAQLTAALEELIAAAPLCERIAVTMTGELADCFNTCTEGVSFILAAAGRAAGQRDVLVYQTNGELVEPDKLLATNPLLAAASNWHALASFAARFCDKQPGLLVDVGSTTVDVIPIVDGKPAARGATDVERLIHRELVYTGVERSPVCAVVDALPYRGHDVPVAQELFATTADAYVLLGDIDEDPDNLDTADGRPRMKEFARQRLGRMICTEFSEHEALVAAAVVLDAQVAQIGRALDQTTRHWERRPNRVIVTGHGEFLAEEAVRRAGWRPTIISLTDKLGDTASRCATAYALAVLARERLDP